MKQGVRILLGFFLFFCRILRRQHYISRTNGYLEFYRKTRNIRRAPLMVYSGGLLPDIKFARCSPAELDLVPISGFEIKVEGRVVEVIFKFIKMDSGS